MAPTMVAIETVSKAEVIMPVMPIQYFVEECQIVEWFSRAPVAVGEYYAVMVGVASGIYLNWEEACSMVDGFNFNRHKRFTDR